MFQQRILTTFVPRYLFVLLIGQVVYMILLEFLVTKARELQIETNELGLC